MLQTFNKISLAMQSTLDEFMQADKEFRQAWTLFEERHLPELEQLDKLREKRNAILDTATRAVREEAESTNEKQLKIGPFTAQKKESKLFHQDMTISRIEERDLYDAAKAAGAVEVKVSISYNVMRKFLEERKIYADFEECEDVKPLTTAISGPKPIAAFAAEMKK